VDALRLCVQRALAYKAAVTETAYLRKQLKKKYEFNKIIGRAPPMQAVFNMIDRVADTDSTILILGESGTGKELVARALHLIVAANLRLLCPSTAAHCGKPARIRAFWTSPGAFTGAINDKKGLFHEADGGTIFLDEVGSMLPCCKAVCSAFSRSTRSGA